MATIGFIGVFVSLRASNQSPKEATYRHDTENSVAGRGEGVPRPSLRRREQLRGESARQCQQEEAAKE